MFSGKKSNIISPEVLAQFDNFKEKFNSSSLSAEALAEQMENVDQRIVEYAKTCKNGEMTTEGFKTSVEEMSFSAKAATVATKALAIAGNMIAMWAISQVISVAVKAIDNYVHRVENANEATEEAISNLESVTSEVESLESQLSDLNDQIKELDPITDAEDIENLKAETAELETQLAILQEKQRIATIETDKAAQESLGMTQASRYKTIQYESAYGGYEESVAYVTKDEELLNAIDAYKEYEEQVQSVQEAMAKLAAEHKTDTKEYRKYEKELEIANQGMADARTHANELAATLNEQVVALTGNTESSLTLKDSVMASITTYNEFLNSINGVTDALKEQSEAVQEIATEPIQWDYSTTITQLDTIKDKLDVLDSTMSKLYDEDSSIGFEDFSSINEAFSDLDNIEHYIQRLQEAGQDTEAVTTVIESLIDSYLEYSGVLDNVTDENRQLITAMLEEMGIANAEAVINGILTTTTAEINAAKQALGITTENLADLTLEEIQRLIEEGNCSEQAKDKLYELYLTQIDLNNNPIDATNSINQLLKMVDASSAAGVALSELGSIMAEISQKQQYLATASGDTSLVQATLKGLQNRAELIKTKALAEFANNTAISANVKYTATPKVEYQGGSSTQKAIEDAAEAAQKAAEEVKEAFEETFDFFDQRVKVLDNALELLKTNVDNVTGAFAKNNLIDAELSITEEKFKNYTDALSMYTEKANEALSKLPSDIAAKIKDGAVDLTTFIGDGNEEVVEAIEDYQNWADKIADCKQELAELKTTIRKLELEKFNNIMEDFTNQFDLREDGKDLISKQIELLEEAGQLIGESFYTTQIEQSRKQLSTLEEEKAKLVEQMTSAISSGRVNYDALTCSNAG